MAINEVVWEPCTDENYWTTESGYVTVVKMEISGETYVYLRNECPYGWSTLVRNGAFKTDIKL